MIRIAVAGFQHETNTFSDNQTTLSHFAKPDNWPALLTGQEIAEEMVEKNIPISGFISEAQNHETELIPLTWCSAPPAGKVESSAYNNITQRIIDQIKNLKHPIDAIYLDLHGAMVSEKIDDADGEFVQRIRDVIGPDTWIIATLDLHANISRLLFETTDLLVTYQTYPHIDMASTGQRAMRLLYAFFNSGKKPHKTFGKFNFLIPITAQCTLIEPLKSIYETISENESNPLTSISFTPGFPLADTINTAPTLACYCHDHTICATNHQQLFKLIENSKPRYNTHYIEQKEIATLINNTDSAPIILADTQDNPGCGGSGDRTGILRELLKLNIPCLVANIYDPETAALAFDAKIGDSITISLGEKSPQSTQTPLKTTATLLHKTDQTCLGTGPFYQGCVIDLGKVVRLKIRNTDVIVTTNNIQLADMSMIRLTRSCPEQYAVVALKSSVHFRAAFNQFIENTHIVISPGLNTAKLSDLDYDKIKKDMHLL